MLWDHSENYQKIHTLLHSESLEDQLARKQKPKPRGKTENLEDVLKKFARMVVIEGDCWRWLGKKNQSGYGRMLLCGKMERAHRASYALMRGPLPDGIFVCHTCDNRFCVNPNHLFLGTHQDNQIDKLLKDRQIRGEKHWNARFSNQQVDEIVERHRRGESVESLGREFGFRKSVYKDLERRFELARFREITRQQVLLRQYAHCTSQPLPSSQQATGA